ncbi:MAG: pyridoxal-phosphate dependent enzyme, partial [Alphaproteobacteria bacterium]
LIIPIGGGGLIAGSAIAAKALKPDIEIVGVEADLYPSMYSAVTGEQRESGGQTLAEGIAVKSAGRLTMPVVKRLISGILLVDEASIEAAVCTFLTIQKTMAEGAGAAALAALMAHRDRFKGRRVGLYLTGGNIDPRILAAIMIRGLRREQKIISLRITIPDRPGVLGRIATLLGEMRANILEVSHRRMLLDVPAKGATLDLTIETRDRSHAAAIRERLEQEGFATVMLDAPGGREAGTA